MPAKSQRPPTTKKRAPARRAPAGAKSTGPDRVVDRTAELSEDLVQELEDGARDALGAVRTFLATVDEALPPHGDGPSRREQITDSALQMAQRLVHTQAEFLRKVVDSAGKSVSR
jgi:hypothetical protein